MKKAYTLSEILITLFIVGIISAIVIPTFMQSKPDENIVKFKKAHETLTQVISELVTSEKYYLNGDLGMKPNGELVDGLHDNDYKYFCKTFADVLNTKKVTCSGTAEIVSGSFCITVHTNRERLDIDCKKAGKNAGNKIYTTDSVLYYEANAKVPFGATEWNAKLASDENTLEQLTELEAQGSSQQGRYFLSTWQDENNFVSLYKTICIDVDGIPDNATANDCVNECPFGYGIRADGKIITGPRADEWLEKAIISRKE